MTDFDKQWARVKEEFQLAQKLAACNRSFDVDSAMLQVHKLVEIVRNENETNIVRRLRAALPKLKKS